MRRSLFVPGIERSPVLLLGAEVRMKRVGLLVLLLCVLVGGLWAEPRRYLGYPNIVRGGQDKLYLWGNDNGRFNVRVTSDRRAALLEGLIKAVNGKFTDVRLVRREPGDILRVSQNGEYLYFRFRVSRLIDGFDFLTDATSLWVRFEADRRKARPQQIHLGRLQIRPANNPFVVGITDDETENIGEFAFDPSLATVDIGKEIPREELDEGSR
jgi:hypothetical protein